MTRRLALVALWAVFAAASVGVGFAAAGLVGDPFGDQQTTAVTGPLPDGTSRPVATAEPSASAPQHPRPRTHGGSSTGRAGSAAPAGPSQTSTSGPGPTHTSRPRPSGSAKPPPSATTQSSERTLSTRGGLVSGSCRNGLVSASASPAVGWSIDRVSGGRVQEAEVRFRRTGGGEGEVEVHAVCRSGVPRFTVSDGGGSGSGGRDE